MSGSTDIRAHGSGWPVARGELERDNRECWQKGWMPRFSLHAMRRGARRNVVPDAVEYVLAYGRVLHRTGIIFHFLAARDVPAEDRRAQWAARLVGTVVLTGPDGAVITVYRNQRALPAIRRKVKYRVGMGGRRPQGSAHMLEDATERLSA